MTVGLFQISGFANSSPDASTKKVDTSTVIAKRAKSSELRFIDCQKLAASSELSDDKVIVASGGFRGGIDATP